VAVDIAKAFHEKVGVTGIVLTRMDGDGRGGAALSMREVTGQPLKYLGMGEGLDALTPFDPERLAGRILGMGDVVEMVEKAQAAISEDDAMAMQEKMMSGKFSLADFKKQITTMQKMGSMSDILGMMRGMSGMKDKIDPSKLDDKQLLRQVAIIDSMTPIERYNPHILNAKRKRRIAAGSGVSVNDVNKLIKSHAQMQQAMKKLKKMGGIGALAGMMGKMGKKFPGM
jgi:signal recognition particle subunit SRP54